MVIFTPNTLIKSSEVNANFAELVALEITKTVDANGWTVIDYKTHKAYLKTIAVTAVTVTNGQRSVQVTFNAPVGITLNSATMNIVHAYVGGFGGHGISGIEMASTSLLGWEIANQYSGGALTFTGSIYIRLEML